MVYVYVAELYPTSVRSIGTGLASMTARFGGIAAPYVILLQTTGVWIPLVIWMHLNIISIQFRYYARELRSLVGPHMAC